MFILLKQPSHLPLVLLCLLPPRPPWIWRADSCIRFSSITFRDLHAQNGSPNSTSPKKVRIFCFCCLHEASHPGTRHLDSHLCRCRAISFISLVLLRHLSVFNANPHHWAVCTEWLSPTLTFIFVCGFHRSELCTKVRLCITDLQVIALQASGRMDTVLFLRGMHGLC